MGNGVPIADVTSGINVITEARNNGVTLVNSLLGQINRFSGDLASYGSQFRESVGSVSINIAPPAAPAMNAPPAPVAFTPSPLDFGSEPPLTTPESVPTLTLPTKPTNSIGYVPSIPGPFDTMAPGSAPGITLPTLPSRPQLDQPTRPLLEVPRISAFIGVKPTYSIISEMPEAFKGEIVTYVEPADNAVSTALWDHLTLLKNRVQAGGTGLPAAIEGAIWSRAADRERGLALGAETDALRQDAARGFHTPTGAAQAKLLQVRNEYGSKMISLGRDVAIKQAELEIANIQKALEQIIPMEQLLVTHENEARRRALDAATQANTAAGQIYDIYMRGFLGGQESRKIGLGIYQGEIQAYEAETRAYSALIDAERAKTDINKALIEQYTAEIGVNAQLIEMYKTEVDAAVAAGRLEELKLKMFELEITAFEAQTKTYIALLQGKTAEAQIYGERVRAYQAELQGYSAEVEAATRVHQSLVERFKLQQGTDQLRVEMYKARVDANASKAKAETDFAAVNNQANSTYAQAIASFNAIQAKVWEASTQAHISAQTAAAQVAKMNLDAVQASKALSQDATKAASQVYAQLISSALSQQHYSVSASGSSSLGANLSESHSFSGE